MQHAAWWGGRARGSVGRVMGGGRGRSRGNLTSSLSAVGYEEGRGRNARAMAAPSPSSQVDGRLSPPRRGRGRPRGSVHD